MKGIFNIHNCQKWLYPDYIETRPCFFRSASSVSYISLRLWIFVHFSFQFYQFLIFMCAYIYKVMLLGANNFKIFLSIWSDLFISSTFFFFFTLMSTSLFYNIIDTTSVFFWSMFTWSPFSYTFIFSFTFCFRQISWKQYMAGF